MIGAIMYVKNIYYEMMTHSDPRTKDWIMLKSSMPTLCLITAYLIFVKVIGPKMMENRKPYQLKTAMVVYNAVQALLSLYLFITGSMYGWLTRFSWICQQPDLAHPDEQALLQNVWLFFLIRFLEFTDTIFFILRKNTRQVTTLHLVHHSLVPLLFWVGMRIAATGHYTLVLYLNAGVHFFMYTYYMLTSLGYSISGFKRYVTIMQLVQFSVVIVHTTQTLLSDCPVPRALGLIILAQALLFFTMFFNFYRKTFTNSAAANTRKYNIFSLEAYEKINEICQMHLHNKIYTPNRKLRVHSD